MMKQEAPTLWITRAIEQSSNLTHEVESMGIRPLQVPLAKRVFYDFNAPLKASLSQCSTAPYLMFTSVNGVESLIENNIDPSALTPAMLCCVGEKTSQAAKSLFPNVDLIMPNTGKPANLSTLCQLIIEHVPSNATLLHIAGADLSSDPQQIFIDSGYVYHRLVGYKMELYAEIIEDSLLLGASKIDGVCLFSSRFAEFFQNLAKTEPLRRRLAKTVCFCLSDAIASKLDQTQFPSQLIAKTQSEQAMLDLINTQQNKLRDMMNE